MRINNRPFDVTQNDFAKMWDFLHQDYAHKQDHFIWHISRLGEWKHGLWNEKKYMPSFFRKHAQLWVDQFDELCGFVLSEDGEDIVFIITRQGFEYLYQEILDWTIQHWLPRYGKLRLEVHEYQSQALSVLESTGFENNGIVATTRIYDLNKKRDEQINLSSDFHLATLSENSDYASKATLNLNGFNNQDTVSAFELLQLEYSRENPAYDSALDVSVVTQSSVHVSSSVAFCDSAHSNAEIEKICTHNNYRRMGLAEVAVRECFRLLAARGIQRAYITGYSVEANGLYEKLGPSSHKRWMHYELRT